MIIFLLFSLLHVLLMLWLLLGWIAIKEKGSDISSDSTFSIVIPVRNESENIGRLLMDINQQTFPLSQLEVLVMDDGSDDGTFEVVESVKKTLSYSLTFCRLRGESGKKAAITRGVGLAANDYILTIDGDCRAGVDWVMAYAAGYDQKDLFMLTGPVLMRGNGGLGALQQVEFACLVAMGAATLKRAKPTMCNGANLSYKREVFAHVAGYTGNEQVPSGDDEFLLQKVFKAFPDKVEFLKDSRAMVVTDVKANMRDLINQRIRWSSKWRHHKEGAIPMFSVLIFIDFFVCLVIFFAALVGWVDALKVLAIMAVRWSVDVLFIGSAGIFFSLSWKRMIGLSFLMQVIYPMFVVMLGLRSLSSKYTWKGRRYT